MARDNIGQTAPQQRYLGRDGKTYNFPPYEGARPIGSGVSSKNSRPRATPYSDITTSVARTGKDQSRERLQYPLENYGYAAEVIFRPIKSDSIIEDLNSTLSGSLNPPSAEDIAEEYAGGNRLGEFSLDPVVSASANKKTEKAKGLIERENLGPRSARARAAIINDTKQFEGANPELNSRTEAYNASPDFIGPECRLYLPQAIQITDGVQIGPIDLGVSGAVAEAAIAGGTTNAYNVAMKAIGATDIASIIDVFRNPNLRSTAGAFATQRAATKLGFQGAAGAISRATGIQVNPNTRSLFRAVNLREFSFTFKMVASSQEEAEMIKEIIKFFRTELYPEEIALSAGETSASLAYRMPNKFDIQFRYRDNQNIATKIKPAYLRNFTATYNPSGMGMHSDGNFLETDIVMSFVEDTTLKRSDVSEGGY